jgi:hypothetical protein
MTSAEAAVVEARHALERAQQEQKNEQRKELLARLAAVRAEKTRAQAEYQRIAGQIKTEREWRAQRQAEIERVRDMIGQSWAQRPKVADFLPDDPEVTQWRRQYARLEAERDKLIARVNAAHETSVLELVRYNDQAAGIIPQLERSEANLLAALDPNARKWMEGGVYPVNPR